LNIPKVTSQPEWCEVARYAGPLTAAAAPVTAASPAAPRSDSAVTVRVTATDVSPHPKVAYRRYAAIVRKVEPLVVLDVSWCFFEQREGRAAKTLLRLEGPLSAFPVVLGRYLKLMSRSARFDLIVLLPSITISAGNAAQCSVPACS